MVQLCKNILLALLIFAVANSSTSARPNHLDGSNQIMDQETNVDPLSNDIQSQWNILRKLVQFAQMSRADDYDQDRNFERAIRGFENKRQSRYRQCYFNPISCFKK